MALWRSMRYASTTRILKSEVKDIVFHFAVEEYLHLWVVFSRPWMAEDELREDRRAAVIPVASAARGASECSLN